MDGKSLHGYTNSEAVDLLRKTQKVVKLKLARLKGSQAMLDDDYEVPSVVAEVSSSANHPSHTRFGSNSIISAQPRYMNGSTVIEVNNGNSAFGGTSSVAEAIAKWEPIIGPQHDIIVSVFIYLIFVSGY